MRMFTVVRIKTAGISIHEVWTESKQAAHELRWPDDSQLIGKFVVNGKISYPERLPAV